MEELPVPVEQINTGTRKKHKNTQRKSEYSRPEKSLPTFHFTQYYHGIINEFILQLFCFIVV